MEKELFSQKLKELLEKFEYQTVRETGVYLHSGGFANADVNDYDDEYWYVILKWGIQNDVQNTVHTEHYKIDKQTYNITDV